MFVCDEYKGPDDYCLILKTYRWLTVNRKMVALL